LVPGDSDLQSAARRLQTGDVVRDRFRGCMLGGAVGDALGAPVEFITRAEILRRFGSDGIGSYVPAYGRIGAITDDTQMALFTAEGLLRGWVQSCQEGTTDYVVTTAHAYLAWLRTQQNRPNSTPSEGAGHGWLYGHPELHSCRAPGNTCLSALGAMATPGEPAANRSKGCGGVMRMAPVGLFDSALARQFSPEQSFRLGTDLAALTHGHPTGALTAGVLAVLILRLTDGATLDEALALAKGVLGEYPDHDETLQAIERAGALSDAALPHHEAIARLGQGWVAEEALAISIYCALVGRDFREGVILAVNHDGDSDSTGAITGNLLGARDGVGAIPDGWLEALELRSVITEIADDLHDCRNWAAGEPELARAEGKSSRRKYSFQGP